MNSLKNKIEIIIGSFYYLYSSLPSKSRLYIYDFYGLSPGGLANGKKGKDYQGHVFWDMVLIKMNNIFPEFKTRYIYILHILFMFLLNFQETWMFPSILPFRPDLAEKMLDYRIIRIFQAKDRASQGGYNGARYYFPNHIYFEKLRDIVENLSDIRGKVLKQDLKSLQTVVQKLVKINSTSQEIFHLLLDHT